MKGISLSLQPGLILSLKKLENVHSNLLPSASISFQREKKKNQQECEQKFLKHASVTYDKIIRFLVTFYIFKLKI